MRRQRIAMVQTVDQYVLVHRAVKELFLEQLRVIDAHPYENVDGDGRPLCGQAKTDEHVVPGMGVNQIETSKTRFYKLPAAKFSQKLT